MIVHSTFNEFIPRPPINRGSSYAVGLRAAWLLNGGAGVKVYGATGFRQDATLTGGTRRATKRGTAIDFNGSSTYANYTIADTNFVGALTISVVAQLDVGSNYHMFAVKNDSDFGKNAAFEFRTTNDPTPVLELVRAHATQFKAHSGGTTTLNKLQHYAVRCSAGNIETVPDFFVNGVKTTGSVSSGFGTGAVAGDSADILLGKRADGWYLNGAMACVMIWSRALTDIEIRKLYVNPLAMFLTRSRPLSSVTASAAGGFFLLMA